MVEEVQIHQQTNWLWKDMQKALMALSSSRKSRIIKAGNQFNGYVSNFTYDRKIKNKNNLCIYFKRKLHPFQSQGVQFSLLI